MSTPETVDFMRLEKQFGWERSPYTKILETRADEITDDLLAETEVDAIVDSSNGEVVGSRRVRAIPVGEHETIRLSQVMTLSEHTVRVTIENTSFGEHKLVTQYKWGVDDQTYQVVTSNVDGGYKKWGFDKPEMKAIKGLMKQARRAINNPPQTGIEQEHAT